MYENRHGRFTAVDPLLASGRSANPQTFNRYAYVSGNPLIRTDPTGLDWYRQPIKDSDRFTYQWFDENPGDEWSAVDFGENSWVVVPSYCFAGESCDGNQDGYLYKSGGRDRGHMANGIILNMLSDAGFGTAQFAYNSYVPINNGFWWALSRPSPFAYNGSETKAPYQMSYWEPETDGEAAVGLTLTGISLYRAAASVGAGRPIRFAGFSTAGTTSGVGTGSATLADVTKRPSNFRKGIDASVWKSAESGSNGGTLCSTCGKEIFWQPGESRYNVWHIDHFNPKWSHRSFEGMTRKQVLDDYNNLETLRFRCVPCNVADNK
jgi:hypothetical protein